MPHLVRKLPKKEIFVSLTTRLGMETKELIDLDSHVYRKNKINLKMPNDCHSEDGIHLINLTRAFYQCWELGNF